MGLVYIVASDLDNSFSNSHVGNPATITLFAAALIGTLIYALIDASVSAVRINLEYHLTSKTGKKHFASLRSVPTYIDGGNNYAFNQGSFGVKLKLR